jgi:tetratricopeptide (TPR) repeat protein
LAVASLLITTAFSGICLHKPKIAGKYRGVSPFKGYADAIDRNGVRSPMQYLIQLFRLVAFTTLFTTAFSAAVYSLPTNFVLAQTFVNSSRESEAENLFQQGIQQYEREEFLEARSSWESALILFQEMGNRTREIYSLNNLGLVHQALGEYAKAIEYYSAAWQLVESGSDSADKILVMSNLLEAYWLGGEHQLALDYAQRLIDLTQEAGDRSTQVKVTIVLADTAFFILVRHSNSNERTNS